MVAAWLCDDAFGHFHLEHERQRGPPGKRFPWCREPPDEEGRADIIGKIGDDVRADTGLGPRVHLHGVTGNDAQLAGEAFREFSERRQAAVIPFHCNQPRAGSQDRAGEAARAWADFERWLTI